MSADRPERPRLPNGPGAAAILAAGVGAMTMGILALAADANGVVKARMSFVHASGALSGVSTCAVLAWLAAWAALGRRWERREVNFPLVNIAAFAMLACGLLLTFPPVMDWLQGR
jgi:hypothetical protein